MNGCRLRRGCRRGPPRTRLPRGVPASSAGRGEQYGCGPARQGTDTWHAEIVPGAVGGWSFAIEAFSDPYLAWRSAVLAKVEAGYTAADLANDVATGAQLLDRAAGSAIRGGCFFCGRLRCFAMFDGSSWEVLRRRAIDAVKIFTGAACGQ